MMAIVDLQGSLQIVNAEANDSFVGVLSQERLDLPEPGKSATLIAGPLVAAMIALGAVLEMLSIRKHRTIKS